MRHVWISILYILLLSILSACTGAKPTAAPPPLILSGIARDSLTIDFGDFQTKAELTYPKDKPGPFPTVILLHGSAAADMDYNRYSSWGNHELLSHNFLDITNYLTPRGIAVLRYNKHYVLGPNNVDWQKYSTHVTPQLLLKDAEKVLDAAQANPKVERHQIFILGWSEGSYIGAALAVQHPDLAGLILQGPLTVSAREIRKSQILDVGIPYFQSIAPDGRVTNEILQKALNGSGGEIAKRGVWVFLDPVAIERGEITIDKALDQDNDQAISIDKELLPKLDVLLDDLFPKSSPYAEQNDLPNTTKQAANIKVPILILQGQNDSATMTKDIPRLEQALKTANHPDYQLKLYPGLGHSLGPADSLINDNFRPIDQRPLDDIVQWIQDHP